MTITTTPKGSENVDTLRIRQPEPVLYKYKPGKSYSLGHNACTSSNTSPRFVVVLQACAQEVLPLHTHHPVAFPRIVDPLDQELHGAGNHRKSCD
jgi:hypothetical protein